MRHFHCSVTWSHDPARCVRWCANAKQCFYDTLQYCFICGSFSAVSDTAAKCLLLHIKCYRYCDYYCLPHPQLAQDAIFFALCRPPWTSLQVRTCVRTKNDNTANLWHVTNSKYLKFTCILFVTLSCFKQNLLFDGQTGHPSSRRAINWKINCVFTLLTSRPTNLFRLVS